MDTNTSPMGAATPSRLRRSSGELLQQLSGPLQCWQLHALWITVAVAVLILTVLFLSAVTFVLGTASFIIRALAWLCECAGVSGAMGYLVEAASMLALVHFGVNLSGLVLEIDTTRTAVHKVR